MPGPTDRIDWRLDPITGDLGLADGLRYTSGRDAVAQQIELSLSMWRGEAFQDLARGVDYLGVIFAEPYREERVLAEVRRALLEIETITRVLSLSAVYRSELRTLEISYEVDTVFGAVAAAATLRGAGA